MAVPSINLELIGLCIVLACTALLIGRSVEIVYGAWDLDGRRTLIQPSAPMFVTQRCHAAVCPVWLLPTTFAPLAVQRASREYSNAILIFALTEDTSVFDLMSGVVAILAGMASTAVQQANSPQRHCCSCQLRT